MSLKQISCDSSGNVFFFTKLLKTSILTHFGTFQDQKGPEDMAHRGHNLHTPESSSDMPVNQISRLYNKNFLRKKPKTSKNPIFTFFL